MNQEEKDYWGDTPQHTIDFAERQCAKNRARMEIERQFDECPECPKCEGWQLLVVDGAYAKCDCTFGRIVPEPLASQMRRKNAEASRETMNGERYGIDALPRRSR